VARKVQKYGRVKGLDGSRIHLATHLPKPGRKKWYTPETFRRRLAHDYEKKVNAGENHCQAGPPRDNLTGSLLAKKVTPKQ